MKRKVVRFGENLKILRNKNNLTQEQLADAVHVARQTVSAWEGGLGKPDIYILAEIHAMFNIPTDELLFGKILEINLEKVEQDTFYEEDREYISSIREKGFYEITEYDLNEFFPIIDLGFSRIMGIAMELKERSYQIMSIYANGFSVYFPTGQEAEKFSEVLYGIIENLIHCEEEKTVVSYSKRIQQRVDGVEIAVLQETHKAIFGGAREDMFYWVDKYDRIRGYAKTEEECREQAKNQECEECIVLHE